jgi:hypothetical protein
MCRGAECVVGLEAVLSMVAKQTHAARRKQTMRGRESSGESERKKKRAMCSRVR